MADFNLILRDGLQVGAPIIAPAVPLGRWEGTNQGSAVLDNIFDDSLYSYYTIVGQFLPITNGANLSAVLRSSTPSDVGGGLIGGLSYSAMLGVGVSGYNVTYLLPSVSNLSTGGITAFKMLLYMGSGGLPHSFFLDLTAYLSTSAWYAITVKGAFLDTTARQGIKFYFSSGNITGWYEVIGHLKQ